MSVLKEDEFEICVSCGRVTNVPRSRHISQRECYIEGCGQLCVPCALTIMKEEELSRYTSPGI